MKPLRRFPDWADVCSAVWKAIDARQEHGTDSDQYREARRRLECIQRRYNVKAEKRYAGAIVPAYARKQYGITR